MPQASLVLVTNKYGRKKNTVGTIKKKKQKSPFAVYYQHAPFRRRLAGIVPLSGDPTATAAQFKAISAAAMILISHT